MNYKDIKMSFLFTRRISGRKTHLKHFQSPKIIFVLCKRTCTEILHFSKNKLNFGFYNAEKQNIIRILRGNCLTIRCRQ